jgi:hypothetical protein
VYSSFRHVVGKIRFGRIVRLLAVLMAWSDLPSGPLWAARGELELSVIDADTREPIAVQIQLRNQQQRLVTPAGLTRDGHWLVFDGQTVLTLPPGPYTFRLRRGLEYRERTGHFLLKSGDADHHRVDLPRFVDMAQDGWWSGDLHVLPQSPTGLATRILASDLHLVAVTRRDNQGDRHWPASAAEQLRQDIGLRRFAEIWTACDRRQGSVTILVGQSSLPVVPSGNQSLPTPFELARAARRSTDGSHVAHVHLAHATCWDMPTWVALGLIDSVGLLHDGLREQSSRETLHDRPRDEVLFPDPEGIGRWAQQAYFQLLESGLRVPPAAGSGSDESGNPLGYSRVYVHCGDDFSPEAWWDGLRAGRVVVTNGPLLRPRINGELPGHVFRGRSGENVQLDVNLQLSTQDPIHYLEIIQNGRPVQQVRLEDWSAQGGQLPPVVFEQSGWVLVRAVAEHPEGYRAAISGPFYVELDGPRISRQAAQFFLDWVDQRARLVRLNEPQQPKAVLLQHRAARDFWQQRLEQSTVD